MESSGWRSSWHLTITRATQRFVCVCVSRVAIGKAEAQLFWLWCLQVKRKVSTTLLTTGEHEYTRYGFRQLLERKCADILQPDVTWVGGLT